MLLKTIVIILLSVGTGLGMYLTILQRRSRLHFLEDARYRLSVRILSVIFYILFGICIYVFIQEFVR